MLWVIGALTSLLTATYMFRLVFLTFHGERRHDAPARRRTRKQHAATHTAHGAHDAWRTRTVARHDAGARRTTRCRRTCTMRRRRWRFALIVLAIGSVAAGYIGVPHALGGHNALARVARAVVRGAAGRRRGRGRRRPRPRPPRRAEARDEDGARADADGACRARIALLGIGIAAFIWLKRREIADAMARTLRGRPPAAAEQVLRRRDLRRRRRPADRGRLAAKGCGAASTSSVDRRRGQRHRRRSSPAAPRCCGGCRPARCAPMPARCSSAWSLILGYYLWR